MVKYQMPLSCLSFRKGIKFEDRYLNHAKDEFEFKEKNSGSFYDLGIGNV